LLGADLGRYMPFRDSTPQWTKFCWKLFWSNFVITEKSTILAEI